MQAELNEEMMCRWAEVITRIRLEVEENIKPFNELGPQIQEGHQASDPRNHANDPTFHAIGLGVW